MIKANDNFKVLEGGYLFNEIGRRVRGYSEKSPKIPLIRMDIGDVSQPIPAICREAMAEGIRRLGSSATFRGYGPERGYLFLRQAICDNDFDGASYLPTPDDIFISDGAKCDLGNILEIISPDASVAYTDPGYPVYADAAAMEGRRQIILKCDADNGFKPSLPEERPDVIILCYPNNPTGVTLSREELQKWVDYALSHECLIIYDSAYMAFVRDADTPRSIFEIKDAQKCSIEIRSYSKTAGFTGIRCGYTVVPRALFAGYSDGTQVSLNDMWNRCQSTKFNGASYISQLAAAAIYTPEGEAEIRRNIDYYMVNAELIRRTLTECGLQCHGGVDAPYIWARIPKGFTSAEFFAHLLDAIGVSCTPGSGFGKEGEGYIRLTAFNTHEATEEAMKRLTGLLKSI